MKVGDLVKQKWDTGYEHGSGIIVEDCGGKVYVRWTNVTFLQLIYKDYLEVLSESR